MGRIVGKAIENGYVWSFPNESFAMSDCLSGRFPADSVDADLGYFDLIYETEGEFGFALARIPTGMQIDVVVEIQFWDVNGNVHMDNSWKVENLDHYYAFLLFKDWPPVAKTETIWTTYVTVRSVKRIVGSGKTPTTVLIDNQRVFTSTSVATMTAESPKMGQLATDMVGIDTELDAPVAVEILSPPLPEYPGWLCPVPNPDFHIDTADDFTFACNSAILFLKVPYFEGLFNAGMTDTTTGRVESQFEAAVMVEFLKFVYEKDFTANLSVVASELCRAADYYQLVKLKDICMEEVVKQISLATLRSTIELAVQFKSIPLMQKCIEFIRKRRTDVHIWNAMSPLGATIPAVLAQISAMANSRGKLDLQNFRFST